MTLGQLADRKLALWNITQRAKRVWLNRGTTSVRYRTFRTSYYRVSYLIKH